MSGTGELPSRNAVRVELESERRDIKDIWNDALRAYHGVLDEELKPVFSSVDAMIESANEQMNAFQKWRHDGTKIDRLRGLFMSNIGYIQTATQKVIAAAEPAFPPAAAIGTAITLVLSACKSVSADYDVVTAFFDDMNNFLQRVSILEARLPVYKAYQACLMDVFTSLLKMCAFARKFVRLGRMKKWVVNAFQGDDSQLAASRKAMDKALNRLESATEFAILANTEDLKGGQEALQSMQQELRQNQQRQLDLQRSQQTMLQAMLEGQMDVKTEIGDIKALLEALRSPSDDRRTMERKKDTGTVTNAVRTVIDNIPEVDSQLQRIKDSLLPGTCGWIFEEPAWKSWYTNPSLENLSPLLLIMGPAGIGKSYLATTIYEHIERDTAKDPGEFSCAVCFFGDESAANLRSFQSVINWTVLQISDTNVILRNRINTVLSQEVNRVPESKYFKELICPLYGSTSQFYLYIVIDAIDALETVWDQNSVFELARIIKGNNLRIKIVVTMRTNAEPAALQALDWDDSVSSNVVRITKDRVLSDIRAIIQHRLQSTDSAFQGIRYLKPNVKELIASMIEEKADGPLYAEQALLYLSSVGREGPIRRFLTAGLPTNVTEWFRKSIAKCERRTPHDLAAPFQFLLVWLLFSFNSLSLNAIAQLLRTATNLVDLDLDEIMDIYSAFLEVHSSSTKTGDGAQTLAIPTVEQALMNETLHTHEDANSRLTFRKRSMREFFLRQQAGTDDFDPRVARSDGHRQLFLLCCQVIEEQASFQKNEEIPKNRSELHNYALRYCLRHWQEVYPELHDLEENVTVCEDFLNLITNEQGFPIQTHAKGLEFTISKLLTSHPNAADEDPDLVFLDHWDQWSKWLRDTAVNSNAAELRSRITESALEYWTKGPSSALIPLAKAYIRVWLAAKGPNEALMAYNLARKVIQKTSMRETLCHEYPVDAFDRVHDDCSMSGGEMAKKALYEEILRLRNASSSFLDSNSHFASAVVAKTVLLNGDCAIREMEYAIEKCNSAVGRFRYLSYMGKLYYWEKFSLDEGLKYFDLALEQSKQVPLTDVLRTMEQKAIVLYREERGNEATAVYKEMCLLDQENPVLDSLAEAEFIMYMRTANWPGLIEAFLAFSAVRQLKVALHWYNWHNPPYEGTHPAIFKGAASARRIDDLAQVYVSMVGSLDISGMGPLWMPFLAQVYWRWYADTVAAKNALTKALNTSCTVQTYPLAEVDTGFIAVRNVNMLSDILFEQFQKSRDLDTKFALLTKEASTLFQRPLPQSVQINNLSKIPHLLVLANMTRKVGNAQEYEKLLRQAFNAAWASLHDSIIGNDTDGVHYLARVIGQIPEFQRDAEILASAMLYYLGDHSFFASFCEREGFSVELNAAADFEKGMDSQMSHKMVRRRSDMATDSEGLYDIYQKYKSAESGCFNTYAFLRELDFDEAWGCESPTCTRSAFCVDIQELDLNSLSHNFDTWQTSPLYTCLFCTESALCQKCYDVRIQWNATGKPDDEPSFCCNNGKYIKSPTQDWQGIKLRSIYLEGQAPIKFDDFLQQIRARWNDHWDRFWLG